MLVAEILIVLLLIVINGVLAGSEMAVVSSRQARLESMAANGSRGARAALELVRDPGSFLSTVQIGITLVGIIAGAYSGATLATQLGVWLNTFPTLSPNGDAIAIGAVVLMITYLSLIIGELVPKRVALGNPEALASVIARPMRILSLIAAPAVWLLRHSSDFVLKALRLGGARESSVTEEEVKSLIAEGTRAGVFAPAEREMIEGVMRLADRTVRAIMTPRSDVGWAALDTPAADVIARLRSEPYTQLLVCETSIDNPVGLVAASDVIGHPDTAELRLADIVRNVPIVPEQTKVLGLLEVFRREREHFAVVVDEYGTTQGVVSATDILESIAGDLPGKGDQDDPMVVQREDGSWLVDGLLQIDEFEDLVGRRGLRDGNAFETVAGYVIDRLGRLPEAGDRLSDGNLSIEVVDMDGRRIDKLLVTVAAENPDTEEN